MKNLLLCFLLIISVKSKGQDCHCKENFEWIKTTFEQNDAGYQYAIDRKGKAAYKKHNDVILKRIEKVANKDSCVSVILDWLSFFRKAHFGLSAIKTNVENTSLPLSQKISPINYEDVKAKVSNLNNPTYEGVWNTEGYTIGIVKNDIGYKGYILSSSNPNWKNGELKLLINKDSTGIYYMGNHSPVKFSTAELIGKNTLNAEIYLNREFPVFKEDTLVSIFAREMSTDTSFLIPLSSKTVLLRIPSFDDNQKSRLLDLLNKNDSLIRRSHNMIIDIRDNGGGSDDVYSKIIDYLYTNPIREINTELYSTKLNNQRMADYLKEPDLDSYSRSYIEKALLKLNANLGKFVNLNNGAYYSVIKRSKVLPEPINVGIIINQNNGSSAEQFLLAAKESKKVKLFGVTTMGVLDISNMYFVNTPDSSFRLGYCLSKSLRIPDMAIDGKGILPDYYIDKSIPNEKWLEYVQGILEE